MTFLVVEMFGYLLGAFLTGTLAGLGLRAWWATTYPPPAAHADPTQQQHITSLQQRLDKLQRGRRDQEVHVAELEEQLAAARSERDDHKGSLAALAGSHESELDDLRVAHRRSEARLAELHQRHDTAMTELRTENQSLVEELRAYEADRSTMDTTLTTMAHDRDRANQEQRDAVRATRVTLNEQATVLQALRATKERLEVELLQAHQDRDASAVLVQRVRAEADDQLATMRRRHAELEAELALRPPEGATPSPAQAPPKTLEEPRRPLPVSPQDAVRARAYAIWVAQGQPAGKSQEIWSQAEAEVSDGPPAES